MFFRIIILNIVFSTMILAVSGSSHATSDREYAPLGDTQKDAGHAVVTIYITCSNGDIVELTEEERDFIYTGYSDSELCAIFGVPEEPEFIPAPVPGPGPGPGPVPLAGPTPWA